MRVGQKQKKIDINIPKLDDFIHKAYINVARKIYKNVYLFELNSPPLQVQRHNRELETIVQECILNAVRESIPIEHILKAYMDETVEEVVTEEIKEQVVEKSEALNARGDTEFIAEGQLPVKATSSSNLSFNDIDSVMHNSGKEEMINAPKTLERLEEISNLRNNQRRMEEDDDDDDKLNISDENIELSGLDIHVIGGNQDVKLNDISLLDDIEVLY
jgi:hypothetical protein